MAGIFSITTPSDRLNLTTEGTAQVVFTVTNRMARPQRGLAKVKPIGNTRREWLSLAGEAERDFSAGGTEQFVLDFSPPQNSPPGEHGFRLDVVSVRNPDEEFTEGPLVTVSISPPKRKPPSKAWIIPVSLIVLLVIAGAVFLVARWLMRDEAPRPDVRVVQPPGKQVIRIVTLGHQDAGKSTLISAITRVLSETGGAKFVPSDQVANPPERAIQGVKLACAEVEYETKAVHYIQVDCKTPTDIEKLLTADGVRFDGAIVLISEPDGPMPQTREQIEVASQKGIPYLVVYLDRTDALQDEELRQLVESETRQLLSDYGFKDDRIALVRGNAMVALNQGDERVGRNSILKLLTALDKHYAK